MAGTHLARLAVSAMLMTFTRWIERSFFMAAQSPTVSVVIPTYNRADFLDAALQSVFAQSYTDYEVIVVDDGSMDSTRDVVAKYGDQVRYIWQENAGPAAARNNGVEAALGDFVAFLDSDDLFHPEKLEKQLLCMNQRPSIGLSYTYFDEISTEGQFIRTQKFDVEGDCYRELLLECQITTSTVMVRKSVLLEAGSSDPSLRLGEDIDTWLRVARLTEVARVPESLTLYRVHANNTVREPQHVLDVYLYITKKHFTQVQPQPFLFRRRVFSRVYARGGQHFLSAQPPQLLNALKCLILAMINNPLSTEVYKLSVRWAFRMIIPESMRRKLRK